VHQEVGLFAQIDVDGYDLRLVSRADRSSRLISNHPPDVRVRDVERRIALVVV